MRQPTRQAIPRCPFAPAAPAQLIRFGDPAGQHRAVRLKALPDDFEAELINANERGQVRASEGSVKHVEVFPMGSVRTPIIGRPRPLPRQRRATPDYTLNCDEPP